MVAGVFVMVDVVLVDKHGEKVGLLEKYAAHRNPGFLHKAISVLLYRKTEGGTEVLLQRRSEKKPLWPLYWANTVCTHPLEGESNLDCAVRRTKEEVGIALDKTKLQELYRFYYQADYDDKMSEHELDVVVVGEWDGGWDLNQEEVDELKWVNLGRLLELLKNPKADESYAPWFLMIIKDSRIRDLLG